MCLCVALLNDIYVRIHNKSTYKYIKVYIHQHTVGPGPDPGAAGGADVTLRVVNVHVT